MAKDQKWELRLYVAGQTPKSILALKNITKYCKEHLEGRYSIEVIDLLKNPSLQKAIRYLPFQHWYEKCRNL